MNHGCRRCIDSFQQDPYPDIGFRRRQAQIGPETIDFVHHQNGNQLIGFRLANDLLGTGPHTLHGVHE